MKKVLKLCTGVVKPIYKEWVFFLFFIFFITPTTLKSFVANLSNVDNMLLVFRYMSLAVLISYIFTLIVYLSKSRLVKTILYIFGLSMFAIYMFLWLVFHTSLSPLMILIMGETNMRETTEFFQTFLTTKGGIVTCLSLVIISSVYLLLENYRNCIRRKFGNRYLKVLTSVAFFIIMFIGAKESVKYHELFLCKTMADIERWGSHGAIFQMDTFTTLLYSMQAPRAAMTETSIGIQLCKEVYRQKNVANNTEPLTVIYVLGESYIKSHAAIYGYTNMTTPRMSEELDSGRLYVFENVISPFNSTTQAEKNSFCSNSLADGEQWYEKPFFPTIFKAAGYDVYMWDIQRDFDNNAMFTFSVNSYLYDKTIQQYSYTASCNKRFNYDEELIDDFFDNIQLENKNNLLIFHLLGQHVEAKERFPNTKEFTPFSIKDVKRKEPYLTDVKKREIADYDNATYYNDYVIGKLMDKYKEENTVMVYISDHGEEIYDYRDSKGRAQSNDIPNFLKYQYDVPCIVWCSDKYIDLHVEIINHVKKSLNRSAMTDNICQLLFSLSDLSTPYYIPERDIISTQYKNTKRMAGSYDYDEYVK